MAETVTNDLGPQSVGEALRNLRQRAALSREQVATICEVSPRTISRVERGETTCDAFTLRCLAVAYAKALGLEHASLWAELTDLIDRHRLSTDIIDARIEILAGRRKTPPTPDE